MRKCSAGFCARGFSGGDESFFLNLSPDWHTVLFIIGLAALSCLLFRLAPALRATRAQPGVVIKTAGRGMTTPRGHFGVQHLLVVCQISLSLVLLVASLLFVRSFRNLITLDPGCREEGVLAADVTFNDQSMPKSTALPVIAATRNSIE